MAIVKNGARVSWTARGSQRGSASSEDDDGEHCAVIGMAEPDASEASFVDSGMGSDELDPVEVGDMGFQLCQLGNQSCSIPVELYDLSDLGSVLSLETWNECLSEEERFTLANYLPDMDRETFFITLKELLSGQRFHFGSPLGVFFSRLKGGLCDPGIDLYRRGLSSLQQRDHYHRLRRYQDSMVRSLIRISDAFKKCEGYSLEEKLGFLNSLKSQRPLSYGRNGDTKSATNSDNEESDKQSKTVNQFTKSSFDITHRGIVKVNTKGVVKVNGSKISAEEVVGASAGHPSALKHEMTSKSRVKMPLRALSQHDKFAGNNVLTAKRARHHIEELDDVEEQFPVSLGDWSSKRRSSEVNSCLFRTKKSSEPVKRHDQGMCIDEEPVDYSDFTYSQRKDRNADHVVATTSYVHEYPEDTKEAKYYERGFVYSTKGQAQSRLPAHSMHENKFHEDASSLKQSVKSNDYNIRANRRKLEREYKTGKDQVSCDLRYRFYKTFPTQMDDSYHHKGHRARKLQRLMKNNSAESEEMDMEYSRGTTKVAQSEETESDNSDQVEDDGEMNDVFRYHSIHVGSPYSGIDKSNYDYKKLNKLMDIDRSGFFSFPDAGRHIHTSDGDSYSAKSKHGGLMKRGLYPSEMLEDTKKHKGLTDKDYSPRKSLHAHDYGSGMMDKNIDNLDEVTYLQGSTNRANRLGNMISVSDPPATKTAFESSIIPLKGCNSASKKPKRRVNGHHSCKPNEYLHIQPSPKQGTGDLNFIRKGEKKLVAEADNLTAVASDLEIAVKYTYDAEPMAELQKKSFTLITPTIHTSFSFSIIHLLSAVRKSLITVHVDDTALRESHHEKAYRRLMQQMNEQDEMNSTTNGVNMDNHPREFARLPSLTFQEIVNCVRSNPGDPCILETQEPLQDLVRGVLKIFSSKTAPLGAKGWRPLVLFEKLNKSWSWSGPVASGSSENDGIEEELSSEAWGIPHKMLVKLVDAFANWLKSGQETLQKIGSLPPPPTSLLSNLDEKERFKDLRAQKSLNTISASSDEVRGYFRREEFLRYSVPDRAFSYTAADGRKSVVAPLRRGGGKPTSKARGHFMLKPDRPPHVTILCIVRDAAARLPGSIGTRADVCTLLRDSQYIVENVSDAQVTQVVSGALDRLHYERDPCVQFDTERKLWVYLHREREEEDFEDDGTSSTKKWKKQRKDSIDQSDTGAVNDVDTGAVNDVDTEAVNDVDTEALAFGGYDTGLNHDNDLIVDTTSFGTGEIAQFACEDVGLDIKTLHSRMGSINVRKSNNNWNDSRMNTVKANKMFYQDNSANEYFDDETSSRERRVQLQYTLL